MRLDGREKIWEALQRIAQPMPQLRPKISFLIIKAGKDDTKQVDVTVVGNDSDILQ